jgi:voltage-gated potassium channel
MINKNFESLKGHIIVCGYGRNGKQTVKELVTHGQTVLVIENDINIIDDLKNTNNIFYLVGDASRDEILNEAFIESANAIITTLPKDADNLFVVITTRIYNKKIPIISRASEPRSQKKLYSAGANKIVMPDKLGGQRMADLIMEPDIFEFIDYILLQDKEQTNLEEISIVNINKTIRELNIRNISGANIIGLKTVEHRYVLNPSSDFLLTNASHIFVLANLEQINKLKKILDQNRDTNF